MPIQAAPGSGLGVNCYPICYPDLFWSLALPCKILILLVPTRRIELRTY